MNEFIDFINDFIKQSNATYKSWPYAGQAKTEGWKECVKLSRAGWKCSESHSNDDGTIMLKWSKDDAERFTTLSFIEQQMLVKFLTEEE